MKFFNKVKEGQKCKTGINITTNDGNAYFNIKFRIPLFVKIKRNEYEDFDSCHYYYGATLMKILYLRARLRTWSFVSSPTCRFKTLYSRLLGMFMFRCKIFHDLIKYESRESYEQREDRINTIHWKGNKYLNMDSEKFCISRADLNSSVGVGGSVRCITDYKNHYAIVAAGHKSFTDIEAAELCRVMCAK